MGDPVQRRTEHDLLIQTKAELLAFEVAHDIALPKFDELAEYVACNRPLVLACLGWLPIHMAKKDGTTIWACFRPDIFPALTPLRSDLEHWNGVQLPLRHNGLAKDGFDIGWQVAAPVGHGGFPDEWIAGWLPMPAPPCNGKAS